MQNKKIVFAIVLFLLIGLTIFTFANPSENEKIYEGGSTTTEQTENEPNDNSESVSKDPDTENELGDASENQVNVGNVENQNNGSTTNTNGNNQSGSNQNNPTPSNPNENEENSKDNLYEKALEAVKKAEESKNQEDVNAARELVNQLDENKEELTKRLDLVQKLIDAERILAKMEEDLVEASNRANILALVDYKEESNIQELINQLANDEMKERLDSINKVIQDESAPVITGIDNDTFTNKDVKVEIKDDNKVVAMLNGKAFDVNTIINEDGVYEIIVTDSAFNETKVSFVIDKTAPVISNVPENNAIVNVDVNPNITEDNIDVVTLTKNGNSVEDYNGSAITESGVYVLTVVDKAGNSASVTFTIDKEAPTATVEYSTVDPTNGAVIVTINASEEVKLNNAGTWNPNGGYATVFKKSHPQNASYQVELEDRAGNKTVIDVKIENIDKDAPTATVTYSTVDPTNRAVVVTINTSEEVKLNNAGTWNPNGGYATVFKKSHPQNASYQVELEDRAGNKTVIDVKIENIDKDAPVVKLFNARNQELPFGAYTHDLYATIEDENIDTILLNGKDYVSGSKISARDNYELVATDKAGNQTIVQFIIDKDAPKITGVANGSYYNTDVTPVVTDKNLSEVTLNGETFQSGTVITEEGSYTLVAKDIAGNKTTVAFTIDKTAPVLEAKSDSVGTENTYSKVSFKLSDNIGLAKVIVNGKEYERTGKWNDLNFQNVDNYVEGENTVVLVDLAGNKTEVKFTYDKTAPKVEKVQIYNKNNVSSSYIKNGETVRVIASFNEKLAEAPTIKIGKYENKFNLIDDGKGNALYSVDITIAADESELTEGVLAYTISGYKDLAGNEGEKVDQTVSKMTLTYDRTAPVLEVKPDSIGTENTYSKVSFKLSDNIGLAKVIVNGKEYERTGKWNDLNFQNVNNYVEGENTVVLVDLAGNQTEVKFTYDKTMPKVEKVQIYNKNNVSSSYIKNGETVRVIATFNEKLAGVPTIKMGKYEKKFSLSDDGKGNAIYVVDVTIAADESELTEGVLAYTISGYKDLAGNEGEKVDQTVSKMNLTYDRTAPVLKVKTDSIGSDNVYSKINFKLGDNIGLAKVIINGKEYERTGKWNDLNFQNVNNYVEGENTVVLVDLAGNKTEVKFTYDKTVPTATVEYSIVDLTNKDVTVIITASEEVKLNNAGTWNPNGGYATVFKKVHPQNTSYQVELEDRAGNKSVVEIKINNIDKEKPVLSLIGDTNLTIEQGTSYVEQGAIGKDNLDGEIKISNPQKIDHYNAQNILTEGVKEVDPLQLGKYVLTYSYKDKAGNEGVVTRTVNVIVPKLPANLAFKNEKFYYRKENDGIHEGYKLVYEATLPFVKGYEIIERGALYTNDENIAHGDSFIYENVDQDILYSIKVDGVTSENIRVNVRGVKPNRYRAGRTYALLKDKYGNTVAVYGKVFETTTPNE